MEALWTITLFGELTFRPARVSAAAVSADMPAGTVRHFRSQKAAALLAYLAFHRGRAVSREFLCDMLWPDEPNAQVTRNRFRVALASLRRQLEPPGVPPGAVIESVGNHQVRLRAETVSTDVADFEKAVRSGAQAQAATLYRGALLPAFYEEWIATERERLAEAFGGIRGALSAGGAGAPPPDMCDLPGVSTVALPLYLTQFFGRETEREHLAALLHDPLARLVTLTGPGGIGKTRLAAEAVRDDPLLRAFMPLADLWDAGQLGHALRQALCLPPDSQADPLEQIALHLNREPKTRIVLDNVEQIAQGTALVIGELLARAPGLFLLVTSRRRLDFPGEREVNLAPLPLPAGDDIEQIAAAPSVRLFLNRVQTVRPDYQITPRNRAEFGALCRLLDGVPLALELAAARSGALTPGQIHARLAEQIGGADAAPGSQGKQEKEARHRSMDAVIEWSYALLPPDLRRLFLALSVFRGGWDVAAAEAVTGEAHALDGLTRLRGHSLITPDVGRFRMLETLRAWADERLDVAARAALHARHAAYYRARGEDAAARAGGAGETDALDRVEADAANLHAAFARAADDADGFAFGGADMPLRLALVLHRLLRARGSLAQALDILGQAEAFAARHARREDAGLRARVLMAAGDLTLVTRGATPARALLQAALPLARQSGDGALVARTLRSLADNALLADDYGAALPLYEEALSAQRGAGDERGAAQTLNSLALLALRDGSDFAKATRLTQEAGDYFRRVGDARMLSYTAFNLGELAMEQENPAQAEPHFRESLALAEELRDDWQRLCALFALARAAGKLHRERCALMRDVFPLALRVGDLLLLADALREQSGDAHNAGDPRRAVALLAAAHSMTRQAGETDADAAAAARIGLPEAALRKAWDRGADLTPEGAVVLATAPESVARR